MAKILEGVNTGDLIIPLSVAGAIILAVLALGLFVYLRRRKDATVKKAKKVKVPKQKKREPIKVGVSESDILRALGGSDNVLSHEAKGSRLIIVLDDVSKIQKEGLDQAGFPPYILSGNKLTVVIEKAALEWEGRIFNS